MQDPLFYPKLSVVRASLSAETHAAERRRAEILLAARRLCSISPPTVVSRRQDPPWFAPDRNSYVSIQTYWWPNPDTADGLPYVHRDGRVGPDVALYDSPRWGLHVDGVRAMTLAAIISGDSAFDDAVSRWLRTWLIEPATRMNPHLRHAQFLPGLNDGTLVGCIDFNVRCSAYLDNLELFYANAPGLLSQDERATIASWFKAMLDWLISPAVRAWHEARTNNIGVYYDLAVAQIAFRCGHLDVARRILEELPGRRIAVQIGADGQLPHELKRTRSFGYTLMTLLGFMELSRLGERLDVRLWDVTVNGSGSIRDAFDFVWNVACSDRCWSFEEIYDVNWSELLVCWRLLPPEIRHQYSLERIAHRLSADETTDPELALLKPHAHPFRPAVWDEFPLLLRTG